MKWNISKLDLKRHIKQSAPATNIRMEKKKSETEIYIVESMSHIFTVYKNVPFT